MKNKFVRTRNVRNIIGLLENLQAKPENVCKMGLVYGEPGLGKSQSALWLASKYDCVFVRATNKMTTRWLLEEIAKELDEIPRFLTADIFNQCVLALTKSPRPIVIDEVDYLLNDFKNIETLRDIHDKTKCPVVVVGMGLAHKKIEKFRHLFDRFTETVKFETFNLADAKAIVEELSEVPFSADAIEILHKKHNRFRQIIRAIYQFEQIAKENNLAEITAEIAKEVLG